MVAFFNNSSFFINKKTCNKKGFQTALQRDVKMIILIGKFNFIFYEMLTLAVAFQETTEFAYVVYTYPFWLECDSPNSL